MPKKKEEKAEREKVEEKKAEVEKAEEVKVEKEKVKVEVKEEVKEEEKAKKVEEKVETEKAEKVEKAEAEKMPKVKEEVRGVVEEVPLWQSKTKLGKDVFEGRITSIDEILDSGRKIVEPEIIDKLVPELKSKLILVGGRTGKGGGIQRIPVKITATMHRSGRRFTMNAFAAVGNEDGLVGIGKASALESRSAIEKAIKKAKLSIIKVKRGCGSWECGCGEPHSIPYKTEGKSGSVRAVLMPGPKGLGLVADDETKKLLRLAGIKDVWVKTYGNTGMRINLLTAVFKALKNLYVYER